MNPEEELKLSKPVDPVSSVVSIADMGMRRMVALHPELTFDLILAALDPVLTDKERAERNEIVAKEELPTVKFVEEAKLVYKLFQDVGLGFQRKEKTMHQEIIEAARRLPEVMAERAVRKFCEENGLKMPRREDVRIVLQ